MKINQELTKLIKNNGGVITTAQANAIGISNESIRNLAAHGIIERVAHGIYVSNDSYYDEMYIAQLRRPKIIFSHDTALFLHGLTDRDPVNYTVTVPKGYNTKAIIQDGYTVFSINKNLYEVGVDSAKTTFGHTVIAYGLERTICDCVRSRSRMDPAIVGESIKRYSKLRNKNLNLLMEMANKFKISRLMQTYMEVLL